MDEQQPQDELPADQPPADRPPRLTVRVPTGETDSAQLELDGKDITPHVIRCRVDLYPKAPVTVELDLVVIAVDVTAGPAALVQVSDQTWELLTMMGWTPPQDDT